MVTCAVILQPLMSVTTTLCNPALSAIAVAVVSALSHRYVYPPLPPVGCYCGDPVALSVAYYWCYLYCMAFENIRLRDGYLCCYTQPLLSVTTTLCNPALSESGCGCGFSIVPQICIPAIATCRLLLWLIRCSLRCILLVLPVLHWP